MKIHYQFLQPSVCNSYGERGFFYEDSEDIPGAPLPRQIDLHRAIAEGENADTIEHLINEGKGTAFAENQLSEHLDINARDCKGYTALHHACMCIPPDIRIMELLLQAGADVHAKSVEEMTPIFFCTTAESLNLLLHRGAHLYQRDIHGRTALHFHVSRPYTTPEIIHAILSHRYPINNPDNAGNTALHLAAIHGITHMVNLLLNAGADASLMNAAGETPAELARKAGYLHLVNQITAPRTPLELLRSALAINKAAYDALQMPPTYLRRSLILLALLVLAPLCFVWATQEPLAAVLEEEASNFLNGFIIISVFPSILCCIISAAQCNSIYDSCCMGHRLKAVRRSRRAGRYLRVSLSLLFATPIVLLFLCSICP